MACFSIATPPRPVDKRPHHSHFHDIDLIDDYAWLKADNWQDVLKDPALLPEPIRAVLEAENAYCDAVMKRTEEAQAALVKEMRARIKEDDSSVPLPDGPFAYAVDYIEGGQHPRFVRFRRHDEALTVLLDGNELARGKAYFKLAGADHSPDHRYLAWSYDDKGSEFFTLKVRDLTVLADLSDHLENTSGDVAWADNGLSFLYVALDDNHRPCKVMQHRLGTPQQEDVLIYEEPDSGFFVHVDKTQSGRFITITSHDHQTSEVRLIEARRPASPARLVAERQTGLEYEVEDHGDRLFILTNAGEREDFAILTCPLDQSAPSGWRDFIPHVQGRLILDMAVYKDYLVRLERDKGLPRLVVHHLADNSERVIEFDDEAYALSLHHGYEFDTATLRLNYSSPKTPSRIYDYDIPTGQKTLRKEQEIPSGHNPDDYITKRLMVPARDGQEVPVTLLYHHQTPLDGSAPCLLYGYGAYGITIPASFNSSCLSLVNRGFVYAVAHIRGGKDKGYAWYRQGKTQHKTNSFNDFMDVAHALIDKKYTSRGRIVAQGGSAGGMLMGAVANMQVDECAGIIAEVPFVDVLNTMLDDTLPLTPPEWPEWGNPITDKEAFDLIRSYAPYENVAAKDYPPMLVLAGLTDPRVTYWEPAKWVTKLRESKTDNHPLLLKTNMDTGHAGASGRFERLKDIALCTVFACLVTDTALENR
jgi:oligopeptidase B